MDVRMRGFRRQVFAFFPLPASCTRSGTPSEHRMEDGGWRNPTQNDRCEAGQQGSRAATPFKPSAAPPQHCVLLLA